MLNTLGVGQPLQPKETGLDHAAYAYYNQENVFNAETEKVKTKAAVRKEVRAVDERKS